ncbi:hypothetical protein R3P38DRAFT_2811366 [Favolaschia claudopus]|uniref:Uncharacterized protein n=1 Tax=Favolaschia claudopus TaxID=2862362 RepID=A0AAV9Z9M9_9AGAR
MARASGFGLALAFAGPWLWLKIFEPEPDRVQWFRAEAEADRWREQIEMKLAEWRTTLRSFAKYTETWTALAAAQNPADIGFVAYAKEQAAIFSRRETEGRDLLKRHVKLYEKYGCIEDEHLDLIQFVTTRRREDTDLWDTILSRHSLRKEVVSDGEETEEEEEDTSEEGESEEDESEVEQDEVDDEGLVSILELSVGNLCAHCRATGWLTRRGGYHTPSKIYSDYVMDLLLQTSRVDFALNPGCAGPPGIASTMFPLVPPYARSVHFCLTASLYSPEVHRVTRKGSQNVSPPTPLPTFPVSCSASRLNPFRSPTNCTLPPLDIQGSMVLFHPSRRGEAASQSPAHDLLLRLSEFLQLELYSKAD